MTIGFIEAPKGRSALELRFDGMEEYDRIQSEIERLLSGNGAGELYSGLDEFSKALSERIGYRTPGIRDDNPVARFSCDGTYSWVFLSSIVELLEAHRMELPFCLAGFYSP